ncbi:hypothetical protein MRX96_057513 [Rhipicephalus microplus]
MFDQLDNAMWLCSPGRWIGNQRWPPQEPWNKPLLRENPLPGPSHPFSELKAERPPPHLTSPHGSPLPRLEGPAIEPEVREEMLAEPLPGAELLPEAEPSMRAEPRPSTAEDEFAGSRTYCSKS